MIHSNDQSRQVRVYNPDSADKSFEGRNVAPNGIITVNAEKLNLAIQRGFKQFNDDNSAQTFMG